MTRALVCAVAICASWAVWPAYSSNRDVSDQRAHADEEQLWVLHTPFETHAHAILIAAAPNLFVAYDTDTCGYLAAWTGSVTFTEERGALPIVRRKGPVQSEGIEGVPWEVRREGELVPCTVHYHGCTFDKGHATLVLEIIASEDAHPIRIEETLAVLTDAELDELWRAWTYDPDGKRPDDWGPRMLRRSFRVHDLPAGLELSMRCARTVKSITSWPGFNGKRDPRRGEFETANGVLVEPVILTFTDTGEAATLECFELR